MSNKKLLSEIARFQSIAGLRPMNSLREDMDMGDDVNELFGLGAKGKYKENDRVKIKDSNSDWRIDKFLGKTDYGEKYKATEIGGNKTEEIYGNQIVGGGMGEDMDMEEDMDMDEDSDYMGAETIEDEPVNELDGDTMEVMKQIGTLVGLTGGVMGVGKILLMYAANQIKKQNPGISDKEAKKKAMQQLQQGMDKSTGGGDRPGPTDSMGVKL